MFSHSKSIGTARTGTNPVVPTPENLKAARIEYEAHCATCHCLDGSGRNRFEAEFNPPVTKLTGGVKKLCDSEIFFIVAHGIRNTAMPAFGRTHSSNDMWRSVLWVRHLGNLTAGEKAEIERGGSTRDEETRNDHGARNECRGTPAMIRRIANPNLLGEIYRHRPQRCGKRP
jgi:mono/diheme cytochrome c family protein